MNLHRVNNVLKKQEGYSEEIYADTKGILTIGHGHALLPGSKMPGRVLDILFQDDLKTAAAEWEIFKRDHNLSHMAGVREEVLVNMMFNLGRTKLTKFVKMIMALQIRDYVKASEEMMDSDWAEDVKGRAKLLAEVMRTGKGSPFDTYLA